MTGFELAEVRSAPSEPAHRDPELVVSAYAKINLTLEVLGKRADGLHEVATVMQTISLADRLSFTPASEITLRHRGPTPADEDDLILRAARLLRAETRATMGCAMECSKLIPMAAGLGGGSADAAATLRGLNELWKTGLRADEMSALAAELGADVPFLIEGGTALGTGTGRELASLPDAPPHWVVLAPIAAENARKTADMYARLGPADMSDGAAARRQATAVAQGQLDYSAVGSAFSRAAAERWPQSATALAALREAEAQATAVSGAGPSVFGLYQSRGAALSGLASLRAAEIPSRLYRFVPRTLLTRREQTG